MNKPVFILSVIFTLLSNFAIASQPPLHNSWQQQTIAEQANKLQPQVVKWRRYFHQHPELSNREFHTANTIAEYLTKLGLKVTTGIAQTGVVAIIDSGKPGKTVALRADMDALPIVEQTDLPFASQQKSQFNDEEVGVMHACGHDTHIAMLMGAATILNQMKNQFRGKVKLIFQPAEEGAPDGEQGGAEIMVQQGVLQNPKVDAIFGLHINSRTNVGTVLYKEKGMMAAVDPFKIEVFGKQAHGAYPWNSVDPIVTAAQIIMGLQTIVSREVKLIDSAAVVTIGKITGGNRSNIIPNKVEMVGTIRSLNPMIRQQIADSVRRKAHYIAASMKATAKVTLPLDYSYPVTYNDPALLQQMLPSIKKAAGAENVQQMQAVTGAEDFAFYQQKVPGLFLYIGGKSPNMPIAKAPDHHTPNFVIDETGMKTGVTLLTQLAIDYLNSK